MKNEMLEKNEKWIDRRKCERFQVKNGGMVICMQEPIILGELIDISKRGLAFCYEQKEGQHIHATELNLIFPEDFLLVFQQFKTINDIEMQNGKTSNSFPLRRHSVTFDKLKDRQQIEELEYFIKFYTLF
jgi:hypothetical protein